MPQNIYLNENAPLAATEICNLGKLNVICGKNNSGKSTVLRAIADQGLSQIGITANEELADSLAHFLAQGTIFINNNEWTVSGIQLRDTIRQTIASKDVWFRKDSGAYLETLKKLWKENRHLRGYNLEDGRYTNGYLTQIRSNEKCVLLPPKRNLESVVGVNFGSKPSPSGDGLTNYLLFATNQENSSPDRQLFEVLSATFTEISGGYTVQIIPMGSNECRLRFRNPQGVYAEANDCGLGLQDLLVILYFSLSPSHNIVLIEEPESHLHPEMQRKLLAFLYAETDKQYFVSTHSNVFLDRAFVDKVLFTQFDGVIHLSDETARAEILSELGYEVTDNLVSDLIVLVEGPTDIPVLETFLMKMGISKNLLIKFWPLGGDIMGQLDLSVFGEKYTIVALVDQDPRSGKVRRQFIEACKAAGIPATRLKRYSIENYFSMKALKAVFGKQIPDGVSEIDPKIPLEKQIGFDVKKRSRNIAREMEIDEIKNTDLYAFLQSLPGLASNKDMSSM